MYTESTKSSFALENANNWYIGLGCGPMRATGFSDYYQEIYATQPQTYDFSTEDEDGGVQIFFGYDFGQYMIEVAHGTFGDINSRIFVTEYATSFDYNSLSILGKWPISQDKKFWLYGKAGLFRGKVQTIAYIPAAPDISLTNKDNSSLFGLGAGYNTEGNFSLRLGLDYLKDAGKGDLPLPISDVQFLSISILYYF